MKKYNRDIRYKIRESLAFDHLDQSGFLSLPPNKTFNQKKERKEKETNQCALCPVGVEVGGGLFRLLLLVSSWSESDSLFILKVNLFSTSSMDLLVVAVVAFPPLLLLLLLLFCVTVLLLLL